MLEDDRKKSRFNADDEGSKKRALGQAKTSHESQTDANQDKKKGKLLNEEEKEAIREKNRYHRAWKRLRPEQYPDSDKSDNENVVGDYDTAAGTDRAGGYLPSV